MENQPKRSVENPWFLKRKYLHFDAPVFEPTAVAYITDTTNICRHSFWPFLRYEKVIKRYWQFKETHKDSPHSKGDDYKKRPIMYAAHMDAHIYSYYSYVLQERYELAIRERGIEGCVLAYRQLKKSNIEFAKACFDVIKDFGNCTVLCFDVKSFFDALDHEYLKKKWMQVLGATLLPKDHFAVFRAVTRHAFVEKKAVDEKFSEGRNRNSRRICSAEEFRNKIRTTGLVNVNSSTKGIPQGSPISSTLANIYMIDFDQVINGYIGTIGGKYWRYADDILIVVPSADSQDAKDMIRAELDRIKLQLSDKKTEEAIFLKGRIKQHFQGGNPTKKDHMQYLGFIYDGTVIRIRPASVSRFYRKIKRGIKAAKIQSKKRNSPINKHRIYGLYSHLGKKNFITYAYRAAEIMESKAIKRQVGRHMKLIAHYLQAL